MTLRWALVATLTLCAATAASAQDDKEDNRAQYPAFLANSYFALNVGRIGYLFSGRQLEPGFDAERIVKPRLAFRLDLFGHHFSRYFSAQATYMRPVEYVEYHNVNGHQGISRVSTAYAGLTMVLRLPLSETVSAYGEGGGGLTSRGGFDIDGQPAVKSAHYTSGMLGAGFSWQVKPKIALSLGATYFPGRRSFNQPSTRLYTAGLQYQIRPLTPAQVDENRSAGYAFPANVVRLGYSTNVVTYAVNNFFSRTVPIFFGGDVEAQRGITLDYQRNVFHTKKWFAFDLGASASYWNSNLNKEVFRTLSGYPMFRFFLHRSDMADYYLCYSVAGPTYITHPELDDMDTGTRFTFQDFMTVGAFVGKARRMNVELGLKHFSNGNLFTNNASIKIPLTVTLGLTL